MKEYVYKEKIVSINKIKHKAIFPENHSNIDGLIYQTIDLNAWDDWANIPDWHTLCMILKKGEKKWETLHDGYTREFNINGSCIHGYGFYGILFLLETKEVRDSFLKKAEIKELKDRIKTDTKRLKILKNS